LQQTLDLLQEAVILRRIQRNGSYWYELYHDIFAKSINDWNRDYKLRQLRWKVAKGVAYALAASTVLTVAYDGYSNYHNRYLQLGPETVSDRVEIYRGEPGSWDLLHQQKFLYETDYARWDIEADKRFQQQALAELDQIEIAQIGQLPLDHRLAAFARVGLFEKADQVGKALLDSKNDALLGTLSKQQGGIRTLASFTAIKQMYRKNPELYDETVISLLTITPQTKRLGIINELLHDNLNCKPKWDVTDLCKQVIIALNQFKPEVSIPKLISLLDAGNDRVREVVAEALGEINALVAIPNLRQQFPI